MITGTVTALEVGQFYGKVDLLDESDGVVETLVLWNNADDAVIPDQVTQSMWMAMCRDSLEGRRITITTTDEDSGVVAIVRLLGT
jgi:hypothetical protein